MDNNAISGEKKELKIQTLLKLMVESGASDLHFAVNSAPAMRLHGEIVRVKMDQLKGDDIKNLIYQVLNEEQRRELEEGLELDFSFGIKGLARFRGNAYHSRGTISAAFRLIPSLIPDFKTLGLPNALMNLTELSNGLILVTGPTGSGKSTTLASMIDALNERENLHIITLEDPIEFVHNHKKSLVDQREVGSDTLSYKKGLKSLLRQDPDVVLVGELRDMETIELALTIAETGHLVFGTLHTNSCVQTINRMINVFPADQQGQVRTLLSFVLQGIVSQQLLPKSYSPGRCLALEVMIPGTAIRNLVREDKVHQIYSQMQVGQDKSGMMTMNQSLMKLVKAGLVSPEASMGYTTMPDELNQMLGGVKSSKKSES